MFCVWLVLGFVVGSLVEWLAHRYVLHNFTIKQLSHSHFKIHHRNSRKNECLDTDYLRFPPTKYSSGLGEIIMLSLLGFLVIPFAFLSLPLWLGLEAHIVLYYYMHRKFHLDPVWGKRWMRCHWDHHMGPNQNTNWGVTNPLFDHILGTRVKLADKQNL